MQTLPKIDDTIQFRIRRQTLSDGSGAFSVEITHDVDDERFGGILDLPTRTEQEAIRLQKKIWDAIKEHTNEAVEFFDEGF